MSGPDRTVSNNVVIGSAIGCLVLTVVAHFDRPAIGCLILSKQIAIEQESSVDVWSSRPRCDGGCSPLPSTRSSATACLT
eukprot:1330048-Rhodomonas_salina.3